jgi:hypothetical protein
MARRVRGKFIFLPTALRSVFIYGGTPGIFQQVAKKPERFARMFSRDAIAERGARAQLSRLG